MVLRFSGLSGDVGCVVEVRGASANCIGAFRLAGQLCTPFENSVVYLEEEDCIICMETNDCEVLDVGLYRGWRV